MKYIPLTNGGRVKVDDDDYAYLSQFSWRGKKSHGGTQTHAVRDVRLGTRKVTIRMHRLITEADAETFVKHINDDGLDNRKSNLQARQIRPWTTRSDESAYRGVEQVSGNSWRATIEFAGNEYVLGDGRDFEHPEKAARAYDRAARDLYGTDARTNF